MLNRDTVVVTGIGLVTSLGYEYNEVWNSMLSGRNGIKKLEDDYDGFKEYQVHVAGIAPEVYFEEFKNIAAQKRVKLRNADKAVKMLVFSGLKALEDAKLTVPDDMEKYNVGAIIGCGTTLAERYSDIPVNERNPKWFFETYSNLILGHLSIAASLSGFGSTIVGACASGTQAIGEAFKKIQYGEEKILLAGGVDNKFSHLHISGFSRLNMTSKCEEPDKAIKPFDKNREGFVIGQGACVLVLVSLSHAKKRGAKIMGRILGYGCSMDSTSIADSSRTGKRYAMERALKDAGLVPEAIDYINAHGTSTISNDKEESMAIKDLFGKRAYSIPVNSSKSILGHTFAACGAIESFVCIKSLEQQRIHLTRNFQEGDEFCDLDYVRDRARDVKMNYCLNNSSGLGGYNSSLIFAKV
jgi:3-oxoacyl-[acyl-carrier-protein] synthase II